MSRQSPSTLFAPAPPVISLRVPLELLDRLDAQISVAGGLKRHGVMLGCLVLGLEQMEQNTKWRTRVEALAKEAERSVRQRARVTGKPAKAAKKKPGAGS